MKIVLLVDDDEDVRGMVAEDLVENGFEVIQAKCGNEAKQIISARGNPDLIISDIVMPDGDGVDLLKHVRENDTRIPPFFLMTGESKVSEKEVLSMGAQSYFKKPFKSQQLIAEIQKQLSLSIL